MWPLGYENKLEPQLAHMNFTFMKGKTFLTVTVKQEKKGSTISAKGRHKKDTRRWSRNKVRFELVGKRLKERIAQKVESGDNDDDHAPSRRQKAKMIESGKRTRS